jgi:hypothetical protein
LDLAELKHTSDKNPEPAFKILPGYVILSGIDNILLLLPVITPAYRGDRRFVQIKYYMVYFTLCNS